MIMKEQLTEKFWNHCFAKPNSDYTALINRDYTATLALLRKHKVKKVLDLGCGYGHWSIVLSKNGFKLTSVDISPVAINILDNWANKENIEIITKVCAAQKMKFPKESFTAVICNSVLDHMLLNDTKRVVNKIKNILKPNGIVYLSFDGFEEENKNHYEILPDGTWLFKKGKHKGMLWRYFTNNEILNLCKEFTVIRFSTKSNGKRSLWLCKCILN